MNKSISLIVFGKKMTLNWDYGKVYFVDYSTNGLLSIKDNICQDDTEYLLFWDGKNAIPTKKQLKEVLGSKGNLWHIGAKTETDSYPKLLDAIQPTSMIHLNVDSSIDHSSWKMSFKGCLMDKKIFDFISLSTYSESLDIIALDFGYKAIQSGVFTRYSQILSENISFSELNINFNDEFLFIKNNFDKKAFLWSYLTNFSKISPLRFYKMFKGEKISLNSVFLNEIKSDLLVDKDTSVSVVIATLERYSFLEKELLELSKLEIPLKEIIIVDQTPKEVRRKLFLDNFKQLPIKYIETDKIGQCSARNLGINTATGKFIWFLDDDMEEIPTNYLQKHLETIHSFNADVSCGIPDEIGTNFIDRSVPKIEISDGFPTNDVLVKRELLLDVGGFDVKMDQKQSEDQEIGLRLMKSGVLSIKNNQLRIVHLRASRGGLRNHNVRKITFASSRNSLTQRRFLHYSEIYLNLKHFGEKKVFKLIFLNIRGTFIIRGGVFKKSLKFLFSLFLFPHTLYSIARTKYKAIKLLNE